MAWLLLVALTIGLYLIRQMYDGPYGKDFTIFLTGANVLTSGQGAHLYDLSVQATVQHSIAGPVRYPGGVLPFNYPPYVAALFTPLTLASPGTAYYIWVAINWLVLVGLLLSFRAYLREHDRDMSEIATLVALALCSFAPIMEAMLMGQMSIVLLALWWWAFVSWRTERWAQLGVAVALAAFKPQMAVLLVVALLAQKRWRALAYMVATQAVLWGVAILLLGPGILTSYIEVLRVSASTVGTLGFFPEAMPNLRGLLTILGLSSDASLQIAMLGWLLSILATAFVWRSRWSFPVRFGITVLLAVMFSPHLYVHDASLLFLTVMCAYIACTEQGKTPDNGWVLLGCTALFAAMYALVLQLWSYVGVILGVWFFAVVMFLVLQTTDDGRQKAISRKQKKLIADS